MVEALRCRILLPLGDCLEDLRPLYASGPYGRFLVSSDLHPALPNIDILRVYPRTARTKAVGNVMQAQ